MLRVRQLALVANDLDPVVDDLKAVFGVEVAFNDPGVSSFGLKNAVIPVGHQFVEPVRGQPGGHHGGGVAGVSTGVTGGAATGAGPGLRGAAGAGCLLT